MDLWDVVQLESGSFMAVGTQVSAGASDHVWLAETDSIGRVLWAKRFASGAQEGQPAVLYTPEDRGLVVAMGTQGWFEYPGGAWVIKVPRKNGEISFAGGAGASTGDLVTAEAPSCIDTEAYPGSVTPLSATLFPITDLVETDLTVLTMVVAP